MLPIRLRDLVQTVSETLRLKLAHDDKSIQERLKKEHGDIIRIQSHEAPDWFGDGWLVSFEVPKHASEAMPIIRAAFFRNDNGKPVLAKDIVVRDGYGNYTALSWTPRGWARSP